MKNKIPKVIHYCWFGGNELPEVAKTCIESWKKYCPDYEIKRWDESNFDINCNNFVKEAYEEKKFAFVSDVARLIIIYNNGGIYLDTDVELIKNLDDLLDYESFFGLEDKNLYNTGLGFGAKRKNVIVKMMLDDYEDSHFKLENGSLDIVPCPIKNSKSIAHILNKFDSFEKINIYEGNYFFPKEYFCPMDNVSGNLMVTEKTYSIHHFSGLWLDKKAIKINKNRRRLCKIFGSKFGKKIVNIYTLPYRIQKKIKILGVKKTFIFVLKKITRGGK